MERKSIGSFIAALRKANGFTQKELAEKLNVSDKAVSRWERDECAPDLSLIPIIAEMFDITADELLSGERRPKSALDDSSKANPRAEKQLQRLLDTALAKLRNLSLVPIILSVCTVLSAVLIPTRAISLVIGIMLVLISVFCEAIFLFNAHTSSCDEDFPADKLEKFNKKTVNFSKIPFAFSFYALYFLVALRGFLIFCTGSYNEVYGQLRELLTTPEHNILSLDVLFIILLYALFAYILFRTIWTVVLTILVKRNAYPLDEQKTKEIKKQRLFFTVISIIISLTLLGETNYYGNGWMNGQHFVEGETFNDADSFIKYVGTKTEDDNPLVKGLYLSHASY